MGLLFFFLCVCSGHPWIVENGLAAAGPLLSSVYDNLRQFLNMNKLQKRAVQLMASNLKLDDIKAVRKAFKELDRDQSGCICVGEMKHALRRANLKITEEQLEGLWEVYDVDGEEKTEKKNGWAKELSSRPRLLPLSSRTSALSVSFSLSFFPLQFLSLDSPISGSESSPIPNFFLSVFRLRVLPFLPYSVLHFLLIHSIFSHSVRYVFFPVLLICISPSSEPYFPFCHSPPIHLPFSALAILLFLLNLPFLIVPFTIILPSSPLSTTLSS